jgi:hypothetical protein
LRLGGVEIVEGGGEFALELMEGGVDLVHLGNYLGAFLAGLRYTILWA